MARKPSDLVMTSLRLREALRRRIEKAAEKNGVSLNHEMVSRLERSFDKEAAQSINQAARRYEQAFVELKKQSDVARAAKTIITLLEPGANSPLPLVEAREKLERAIKQTEQQEAAAYQKLTTSGDDQ